MRIDEESRLGQSELKYDVQIVEEKLREILVKNYRKLLTENNFENSFLPEINQRLAYRGVKVIYEEDSKTPHKEYVLAGINNYGHAILQSADGDKINVNVGRIRPVNF